MKFAIYTYGDNGSGQKFDNREAILKEIELMIQDAEYNGAGYFDITVDCDASCFAPERE